MLNSWVGELDHATGEAIGLARALDVDPGLLLDAVSGGPLDNGYLRAKSAAILDGDFTPSFTVANALEDARLIVEAAGRAGLRLDLAEAGAARLERAERGGRGEDDMAASYFASFEGGEEGAGAAAGGAEGRRGEAGALAGGRSVRARGQPGHGGAGSRAVILRRTRRSW
ncbi:NAD-binding protein [Streptomyces wuyuanensis]|uniref:NAD-binding of NADP-dependent 3-hydroxyisobutyrate dehydrogenase n=1 Tax=Streptomyces wuyuanensis TaxID=1196353 RepID=A0A1G9PYY8_9ACTN|nr:NAD-binding protein [Streptomyces wuyuanensis]SDM04032.1 NAD-binding of NADP-dependent 3-hydroxyisobutyrate dehydrogenase [Streptomyces wuyuanensis]